MHGNTPERATGVLSPDPVLGSRQRALGRQPTHGARLLVSYPLRIYRFTPTVAAWNWLSAMLRLCCYFAPAFLNTVGQIRLTNADCCQVNGFVQDS